MLQVARLAPKLLGESADLVADFLRGQWNADGGFKDRAGASDLYYTVFGLDGLLALRADVPQWCASRLSALVRRRRRARSGPSWLAWPRLGRAAARRFASSARPTEFLRDWKAHRSADGGYHAARARSTARSTAAFWPGAPIRTSAANARAGATARTASNQLQAADGGLRNQADMPIGLTAADGRGRHAAAASRPTGAAGARRVAVGPPCARREVFSPCPAHRLPDLLSTATALHALAGMQVDLRADQRARVSISSTRSGPTAAASTATGATMNSTANTPITACWPSGI